MTDAVDARAVTGSVVRMPRRPLVVAAAVAVVGVCAAAIAFGLLHPVPAQPDRAWDALMTAVRTRPLTMIARGFALLGAGLPAVVIALLAAVLVWGRRGAWWAIVLLAACLVDEGEVRLLKTIAHRMRPDVMFGSASAFPSGHTAFAALLGTVLLLLLPALATRVAVPLLVAGMAWSRTELHAHWLTDVVAGAALGAATAVLVVALAVRVARALPAERLQRPGVELLRRRRAVGR